MGECSLHKVQRVQRSRGREQLGVSEELKEGQCHLSLAWGVMGWQDHAVQDSLTKGRSLSFIPGEGEGSDKF